MKAGLEEEWNRRWQAVLGKNMRKEQTKWSRRWQAFLVKSQSKRGWRWRGPQGGRQSSLRVKVSVGGGGGDHKVAGGSRLESE